MRDFSLGKTEVTAAAYASCIAVGACPGEARQRDDASCSLTAEKTDQPVNCVTFEEASAFCRWIGGRLPAAEEWEFAAKGGEDRLYPWGNDPPTSERANYAGAGTSAPGRFPKGAGKAGLQDLAGNVWEWTTTMGVGKAREAKGGSWYARPAQLRTSARLLLDPTAWSAAVGVRCAR